MIFFEQASLLQHGINFGQVDNFVLQNFCHVMKATFLDSNFFAQKVIFAK